MANGEELSGGRTREVLINIPCRVPSPQAFADCGLTDDIYWEFRRDLEIVAQQMAQKFLTQLLDAATEGVGMVAESVIKAAVAVDKSLNSFVKLQEEHALRSDQRTEDPDGNKRNGNNRNKKKRQRRNRSRRAKNYGSKG